MPFDPMTSSHAPLRAAAVVPETEGADATETLVTLGWRVILFNDEIHTFEEVILQLILATGCTQEQAEGHAWTVHTKGKCCVYEGDFEDCFRVQGVLKEIQLVTEIQG